VPKVEESNNLDDYNSKKPKYEKKLEVEDDVQARYEQLVKSGATAISSDMLFGDDKPKESNGEGGRWSTPASLADLGEKLQDHLQARSSIGSGGSLGEHVKNAKQSLKNYAPNAYN